jgi:hypothetical protein
MDLFKTPYFLMSVVCNYCFKVKFLSLIIILKMVSGHLRTKEKVPECLPTDYPLPKFNYGNCSSKHINIHCPHEREWCDDTNGTLKLRMKAFFSLTTVISSVPCPSSTVPLSAVTVASLRSGVLTTHQIACAAMNDKPYPQGRLFCFN